MKQGKKIVVFEVLFLFLFSFLPYIWLEPGFVVMGHDSGFRINFLTYYKSLLYAFNPVMNLGVDWQLYKGFLLTQLPEFLGTLLTGSWEMGQRFMMQYWLFLIPLSMYTLMRNVFRDKDQWIVRITASLFYLFNFFILQGMFIVERAKFSLFAALPIAILLVYRVLVEKKKIIPNAILFGLLYFFCSGGGSPPLYGATLVALPVTFLFFSFLSWKKDGLPAIKRSILAGALFAIAFVGMNSYWIIPQVKLYTQTYGSAVAERGGVDGLLAWERVNSKNAGIDNLVRLQGIPDWYDNPIHPFSHLYLTNPLLIILSFVPVVCIAFAFFIHIVKRKKIPPVIILSGLLLGIGLIFSGGTHPPFGVFYEYAMRHVPGFAIFRSSIYKFGPLLWFSMTLLFGYSVWFSISLVRLKAVRLSLGILVILFVIGYHFPFFTSSFFRFHERFTTKLTVPPYVSAMADYANKETNPENRIMILPELTSSFYNLQMDAYDWGFFSLDILPRNAIDRSIIANDNNAGPVIHRLYSELMNGTPGSFTRMASLFGIEYILWRNDALYSASVVDGRTIEAQRLKLDTLGVQLIQRQGAWELYSLPASPQALVRVAGKSTCGKDIAHPLDFVLIAKSLDEVLIENCPDPTVFEAHCLHCNLGEYDKMVADTQIATIKYPPGDVFFTRIFDREKEAYTKAGTDLEQLFDANLSKANNRVGLLRFTDDELAKGKLDRQTIVSEYLDAMSKSQVLLDQLEGRQKNVYAIRFLLFIDVHKKELGTSYPQIEKTLTEYRDIIEDVAWFTTDVRAPKYELEMNEDGVYTISVANESIEPSITVDGLQVFPGTSIPMSKGYHMIEVRGGKSIDGAAPILFFQKATANVIPLETSTLPFTKIDPTRFDVQEVGLPVPFTLIFNFHFDDRWKVSYETKEGKTVVLPDSFHVRVNGSVNGWQITDPKINNVTVYYEPQKYFYIGAIISIFTLLTSAVYGLFLSKR